VPALCGENYSGRRREDLSFPSRASRRSKLLSGSSYRAGFFAFPDLPCWREDPEKVEDPSSSDVTEKIT